MEVCVAPLGAALHACTEADLPSQGSGFSCERSTELGQLSFSPPDHSPRSAQMNAMAQILLQCGVGRGEGLAPTVQSSLDIQSSLVRSEDQYVGQGKERPSSYPAVWDMSCIINIHSPKAAFPPTSQNPPSRSGREVSVALPGAALWAHLPLAGWRELGKPVLTWHLQRCLRGACGLRENKKVLFLTKTQTSTETLLWRGGRQQLSGILLLQLSSRNPANESKIPSNLPYIPLGFFVVVVGLSFWFFVCLFFKA